MKKKEARPPTDDMSSRRPATAWSEAAKGLLKSEMARRNVSYAQLAMLLERDGVPASAESLVTRVNRGQFTFAFFIQAVTAMGCETVHLTGLRHDGGKFSVPSNTR